MYIHRYIDIDVIDIDYIDIDIDAICQGHFSHNLLSLTAATAGSGWGES